MNVFTVIIALGLASAAYGIAWILRQTLSLSYWLAVPIGVCCVALAVALHFWRNRFFLPRCETGSCGTDDYTVLLSKGKVCALCRCGREYVLVGNRCFAVSEDGAMLPFKRRTLFGEWVEDKARG
jgi:hypothetical protein